MVAAAGDSPGRDWQGAASAAIIELVRISLVNEKFGPIIVSSLSLSNSGVLEGIGL